MPAEMSLKVFACIESQAMEPRTARKPPPGHASAASVTSEDAGCLPALAVAAATYPRLSAPSELAPTSLRSSSESDALVITKIGDFRTTSLPKTPPAADMGRAGDHANASARPLSFPPCRMSHRLFSRRMVPLLISCRMRHRPIRVAVSPSAMFGSPGRGISLITADCRR